MYEYTHRKLLDKIKRKVSILTLIDFNLKEIIKKALHKTLLHVVAIILKQRKNPF